MTTLHHVWQLLPRPPARLVIATVLVAFLLTCSMDPQEALARSNASASGLDVSWPQCPGGVSSLGGGQLFTIIGVTGGRAFTRNSCLAGEYRWAVAQGQAPALYMNLNYLSPLTAARGQSGPGGTCRNNDAACQAFNYGYNAGQDALSYAQSLGARSPGWWLDVETTNSWSNDTSLNAQVIRGAILFFQAHDLAVGIYSVAFMWRDIAGAYSPGLPIWVARTNPSIPIMAYCSPSYGFGVGTTMLVQSWNGSFDDDYGCSGPALAGARALLGGTSLVPDGSTLFPLPLAAQASGTLVASEGGTAINYILPSTGAGGRQTATLSFWPHGPDVANGVFVTISQNGIPLTKVRGSDSTTPGYLTLSVSSRSNAPLVLQIVNYNTPAPGTEVSYDLRLE